MTPPTRKVVNITITERGRGVWQKWNDVFDDKSSVPTQHAHAIDERKECVCVTDLLALCAVHVKKQRSMRYFTEIAGFK